LKKSQTHIMTDVFGTKIFKPNKLTLMMLVVIGFNDS